MEVQDMSNVPELKIPGTDKVLRPGYKVKLKRFSEELWIVGFGWYVADGNRPCNGWYLTSESYDITKPLHADDLYDIYVLQLCYIQDSDNTSVEEIASKMQELEKRIESLENPEGVTTK